MDWRATTWSQWLVAGAIFLAINYYLSVIQADWEHPSGYDAPHETEHGQGQG